MSGTPPTPGVTAGVVFQQPRLFPWRTVGGNVDLALKYAKVPRERRTARRDQLLSRVGLEGTADRKIWEISGGQQQRVAIARALAAETPLFLLDEPFAALDALTRERLQEDVRQVSAESGRTTCSSPTAPTRPRSWARGSWCSPDVRGKWHLTSRSICPARVSTATNFVVHPNTRRFAPRSVARSRPRRRNKTHADFRCGESPGLGLASNQLSALSIEGWPPHVRNHRRTRIIEG